MNYDKYGDDKDRDLFSSIPPEEDEWIMYAVNYVMERYCDEFPLSEALVKDKAQDCYDYWYQVDFKRKKKPIRSFCRTIETWMRKNPYHTMADKKTIWENNNVQERMY